MLLGLTRPTCSANLAALQLDRHHYKPKGVEFFASSFRKTIFSGKSF